MLGEMADLPASPRIVRRHVVAPNCTHCGDTAFCADVNDAPDACESCGIAGEYDSDMRAYEAADWDGDAFCGQPVCTDCDERRANLAEYLNEDMAAGRWMETREVRRAA